MELTEKLAQLFSISSQQISQIYKQGPTGIHVLISDEVATSQCSLFPASCPSWFVADAARGGLWEGPCSAASAPPACSAVLWLCCESRVGSCCGRTLVHLACWFGSSALESWMKE